MCTKSGKTSPVGIHVTSPCTIHGSEHNLRPIKNGREKKYARGDYLAVDFLDKSSGGLKDQRTSAHIDSFISALSNRAGACLAHGPNECVRVSCKHLR